MTKETYIALIQKDIRELSLIANGLNETDFPTPTVIRLASDKAIEIVNNLQRLSQCKHSEETTTSAERERQDQAEAEYIKQQEEQTERERQAQAEAERIKQQEEQTERERQAQVASSASAPKSLIDRTEIKPTKTESVIGTRETKVERIISQNNKALADRMANTRISSLRQAISMGDRFRFQRELFSNNADTMNKAIADIDACSDIYAAEDYINDHFDWDPENEAVHDFLILLGRRF